MLFFLLSLNGFAQENGVDSTEKSILISGYSEWYFGWDGKKVQDARRPEFLYNFNKQRQLNTNLSFVRIKFSREYFRSNLALGAGTYMRANYAGEKGLWKHVVEANVGVKLSRKKNIWVDVGVMPSHLGFESAIGKDNWNATRSILAENSPYFESGIKLSFQSKDQRLQLAGFLLNGWQRIKPLSGKFLQHLGTQIVYTPSNSVSLNYSNFWSGEIVHSTYVRRHFHNLYGTIQLPSRFSLIIGLDLGFQQVDPHQKRYDHWYSYVGILRYKPSNDLTISVRGEKYMDKREILIKSGGYSLNGCSLNVDYSFSPHFLWRAEGRLFTNQAEPFIRTDGPNKRYTMLTSAVSFFF